MITLAASEVEHLLRKLCIDLGFCLSPRTVLRFQQTPPTDVDSFTDAVFVAEELDPFADQRLREQVRAIVSDAFARTLR